MATAATRTFDPTGTQVVGPLRDLRLAEQVVLIESVGEELAALSAGRGNYIAACPRT